MQRFVVTLGLVLVLSLMAIQGGAAAQPRYGGELSIAVPGDMSSLDLINTTHYVDRIILFNVYESLFTLGENAEVLPMLVQTFDVNEDSTVYTLRLRRGVKFHNGKELKAEDVIYTLERAMREGARVGELTETIASVRELDDYMVEVKLKRPLGSFPAVLANPIAAIVVIPKGLVEEQGGTITHPIGTGPFKFKEWRRGQRVILERFDDYTVDERPASGFAGEKRPYVDRVVFVPITDPSIRLAALESGDVNVAMDLPLQEAEALQGTSNLEISIIPSVTYGDLRFGFKRGKLANNQKLRQAIAYAIDKQEIVDATTFGRGAPAPSALLPGSTYFVDSVHGQDPYARADIEKARQLAREAGYRGEEIDFIAHLTPGWIAEAAVVIQAQLQVAGFNVRLRTLESAALGEAWANGDFELFASGMTLRPDADTYYCQFWHSGGSQAGYNNPEYDRLCELGRSLASDEARREVYIQLEQLMREDVPWMPTHFITDIQGWQKRVKGWKHWSAGYARAWNVWIEE